MKKAVKNFKAMSTILPTITLEELNRKLQSRELPEDIDSIGEYKKESVVSYLNSVIEGVKFIRMKENRIGIVFPTEDGDFRSTGRMLRFKDSGSWSFEICSNKSCNQDKIAKRERTADKLGLPINKGKYVQIREIPNTDKLYTVLKEYYSTAK